MKGKYAVTVRNNTLCYQFEIRRNITVIKGDSATGKTTLIEMIREFYEDGKSSGIELNCDKECAVLEGRNWNIILQSMHDCIIFIDEGNSFVMTDEFSDAVRKSDNYFVIVTRENLPNLPYSVTNDTYLQYSKTKLNSSYLNDKVKSKIIDVIPDVLNLSEKPTD